MNAGLFLISAGGDPVRADKKEDDYLCRFDEGYAQRFMRHLKNDPCLCTACGDDCYSCRSKLVPDLSESIAGHLKLPRLTDQFIDEPEEILPERFPQHEITIAIGIHSDLLIEVPQLASQAGSKALIVPIEDPDWLGAWTKRELEEKCARLGLEFAAPKPFCALTGDGFTHIKRFIEEFRVGHPRIEFEIEDDIIKNVRVITSAPCGATFYLARLLKGQKVFFDGDGDSDNGSDSGLLQLACKGLSSYPCTASTKIDPQFKDSITHKANYIMMDVVAAALRSAGAGSNR